MHHKITPSSTVRRLSSQNRQILKEMVTDENGPGTVLRDFETLLRFIGPAGTKVGSKAGFLPAEALPKLNAELVHPLQIGVERPQQKSYPNINCLYLLLRASGMSHVTKQGKDNLLFLDETVMQSWRNLNPTERFFTLLESWLLRGKPEILGERPWGILGPAIKWATLFSNIPDQGLEVSGNKSAEHTITYSLGLSGVAMLNLFGLINVESAAPEQGKGWLIARIQRTDFGDALLQLLYEPLTYWEDYGAYEKNALSPSFGLLQPLLQPLFPEWQKNLTVPEPGFRDGVYVFKVSIGRIWRRIAAPGRLDMDSLSRIVLESFDFDYDHLYSFTFKSRFGTDVSVNHPGTEDDPPLADTTLIGELEFRPGLEIEFLYDFGDMWKFRIQLEEIRPADPKMAKAVIIESRGQAPEQYDRWDEDE